MSNPDITLINTQIAKVLAEIADELCEYVDEEKDELLPVRWCLRKVASRLQPNDHDKDRAEEDAFLRKAAERVFQQLDAAENNKQNPNDALVSKDLDTLRLCWARYVDGDDNVPGTAYIAALEAALTERDTQARDYKTLYDETQEASLRLVTKLTTAEKALAERDTQIEYLKRSLSFKINDQITQRDRANRAEAEVKELHDLVARPNAHTTGLMECARDAILELKESKRGKLDRKKARKILGHCIDEHFCRTQGMEPTLDALETCIESVASVAVVDDAEADRLDKISYEAFMRSPGPTNPENPASFAINPAKRRDAIRAILAAARIATVTREQIREAIHALGHEGDTLNRRDWPCGLCDRQADAVMAEILGTKP